MGSAKKVTVGFKYFMAMHLAVCYGPIDRLRKIMVGDRVAWTGRVESSQQITISAPELFGGKKREGGIEGPAEVMMGAADQTLPSMVAALLPSPSPAFRGIFSIFYDGLIAANNPYVKPWAVQLERIKAGWHDETPWYPTTAAIAFGEDPAGGAFEDNFESLAPYTVVGAGQPIWSLTTSPFGGALKIASQNSANYAQLERAVPIDFVPNGFSCAFLIEEDRIDDAPYVQYTAAPIGMFFFSPRRENVFDPARRPRVYVNATEIFMGDEALELGTWYRFTLTWDSVTGAWTASISDAGGSGVVSTVSGTAPIVSPGVSRLYFHADENGATVPVQFAQVRVLGPGSLNAMNGAHIVYQCLTDPQWGMGYPVAAIDEASFTAAADTLFAEGFGLCMQWTDQEEIGAFVRIVLDHIGGVVYDDRSTGKFALKLLRGDYELASLPVFDPSNVVALESFDRVAYGETVNEITVVFRDQIGNRDASITVHNLANIQAQGAVISQTRQYPGLPTAGLAGRVAQRDLKASSTPLAKARITVNRTAWSLTPGDVIKLVWPKEGIAGVAFRVVAIDYGNLEAGTIAVDIAEDVFGLLASSYVEQEATGWVDESTAPAAIVLQQIVELPYRSIAAEVGPADLALVDVDASYFAALATSPSGSALGFDIFSRVGLAAYEESGTGIFVPTAVATAALTVTTSTVVLGSAVDLDDVEVDSLAVIGSGRLAEWVKVTAINLAVPSVTVARGVLDTVPQAHAAGARIWFDDGRAAFDRTERATNETVNFKLSTLSTGGALNFALASTLTATAAQRQARPYPPGKVQIDGVDYPTFVVAPFLVSWAHRDRIQQTAYIVEQGEASIGPEVGTTYSGWIYDDATDVLLDSATGITGTTWSPSVFVIGRVRVELASVRDSIESWQRQVRVFDYVPAGRITEDGSELRATEEAELREQEQPL